MFTHYIKSITIKSLRDYILDANLTDVDTILLNQIDFDNIVLEYRDFYKEGITLPYLLLGVLIKEDDTYSVVPNRIEVIQNDIYSTREVEEDEPDLNEPIYRCGWCGNIVDYDGSQLSNEMGQYKVTLLNKYKDRVIVKHLDGYCCKHKRSGQ